MSQLLKKFALLTACAVLALCFATRPAHAQTVASEGLGDHLIFSYWATKAGMDTLLSIHSPLGVMLDNEKKNVVQIMIEDDMGQDVGMFPICLKPGDSWTAVLSMKGDGESYLTVKDPGECDGDIAASVQAQSSRANPNPITTPGMDEMVSVGASTGLIHAYTKPDGTLMDAGTNADGSADADGSTDVDDATPSMILGTAYLLSPMSGFSSSYNAVALRSPATATSATVVCGQMALNNGAANAEVADQMVGGCSETQISEIALRNRFRLLGRWAALNDENVMTMTTAVVTFPGTTPLMLMAGEDADGTAVEKSTDAVTLILFNDMGRDVFTSHEVMLNKAVNMCTVGDMMDMMGDDMMGDDMMGDDMMGDDMMEMPQVMCNGMSLGQLESYGSGGFQIINNMAGNVDEDSGTYTGTNAYSSGAEKMMADDFNAAVMPDMSEGERGADGTVTAADGANGEFPAIGIVLSFFEGTDEKKYDQANALQASMK